MGDLARERGVFRRVDHIHARTKDRDGPTADRQRASVCGRVDAAGQTAHDGDATRGKLGAQLLSNR
jgi:hypothetical protein